MRDPPPQHIGKLGRGITARAESCMCACMHAPPPRSLFAAPSLKDAQLHTAVIVLTRLLKTQPGLAILPGALPYLDAALKSPRVPLRKMAAEQYGVLLKRGSSSSDALQQRGAVLTQLIQAMQVCCRSDMQIRPDQRHASPCSSCLTCIITATTMGPLLLAGQGHRRGSGG